MAALTANAFIELTRSVCEQSLPLCSTCCFFPGGSRNQC